MKTMLPLVQAVGMALLCGSSVYAGQSVTVPGQESGQSEPLKVIRMYADAAGETHFETIEMPLVAGGGPVKGLPATGSVRFNRYPANLKGDFHTCGCRMYLVVMSGGGLQIEVTDGSKADLRPGSIMYFDDMKKPSKGQRGRALGGETLVMYVSLEPDK